MLSIAHCFYPLLRLCSNHCLDYVIHLLIAHYVIHCSAPTETPIARVHHSDLMSQPLTSRGLTLQEAKQLSPGAKHPLTVKIRVQQNPWESSQKWLGLDE